MPDTSLVQVSTDPTTLESILKLGSYVLVGLLSLIGGVLLPFAKGAAAELFERRKESRVASKDANRHAYQENKRYWVHIHRLLRLEDGASDSLELKKLMQRLRNSNDVDFPNKKLQWLWKEHRILIISMGEKLLDLGLDSITDEEKKQYNESFKKFEARRVKVFGEWVSGRPLGKRELEYKPGE